MGYERQEIGGRKTYSLIRILTNLLAEEFAHPVFLCVTAAAAHEAGDYEGHDVVCVCVFFGYGMGRR